MKAFFLLTFAVLAKALLHKMPGKVAVDGPELGGSLEDDVQMLSQKLQDLVARVDDLEQRVDSGSGGYSGQDIVTAVEIDEIRSLLAELDVSMTNTVYKDQLIVFAVRDIIETLSEGAGADGDALKALIDYNAKAMFKAEGIDNGLDTLLNFGLDQQEARLSPPRTAGEEILSLLKKLKVTRETVEEAGRMLLTLLSATENSLDEYNTEKQAGRDFIEYVNTLTASSQTDEDTTTTTTTATTTTAPVIDTADSGPEREIKAALRNFLLKEEVNRILKDLEQDVDRK